jgi:hypothetical protein
VRRLLQRLLGPPGLSLRRRSAGAFGLIDGVPAAGAGLTDGVPAVAAGSTDGVLLVAVGSIGGKRHCRVCSEFQENNQHYQALEENRARAGKLCATVKLTRNDTR